MKTGEERKGQAQEQDKQYGTVKWDPSRENNLARTFVHSSESPRSFHKSQTRGLSQHRDPDAGHRGAVG
jgi:hypothetical protein